MGQRGAIYGGLPPCKECKRWLASTKWFFEACATLLAETEREIERELPTPEGVEAAAAKRIAGERTRTPLLPVEWQGGRLWVKAECLQQGGSFKLRGATNRLLQLGEEERRRGVVAFSSGNHAQGVAIAARKLGIAATIVMPADAPGGEAARRRWPRAPASSPTTAPPKAGGDRRPPRAERGATLVPSFDDVDIIEGQGRPASRSPSSSGRAAGQGVCLRRRRAFGRHRAGAARRRRSSPVEPKGWDDMARSLEGRDRARRRRRAAHPLRRAPDQARLAAHLRMRCRARRARHLGHRGGGRRRDGFAARRLRLVVEPGGAAALAACSRATADARRLRAGGRRRLHQAGQVMSRTAPRARGFAAACLMLIAALVMWGNVGDRCWRAYAHPTTAG
jgi:threonine dehydratase